MLAKLDFGQRRCWRRREDGRARNRLSNDCYRGHLVLALRGPSSLECRRALDDCSEKLLSLLAVSPTLWLLEPEARHRLTPFRVA
jgi:hypothetical protein